jgi:signal transduction histidine kinase
VKQETYRYWRRIIAGNLIASAVVLFAFSGVTWRTPRSAVLHAYLIALLFSMCIGPIVGTTMPRLAPWVWGRARFPLNWIVITMAMAAMAIAGSLAAILVLVAIGQVPAQDFGQWFQGSIRIAIVVTLTIGLFITAYEMTRARVAQASAQAQLASLESRVQPHFLFNTLNSIAALIHEDPKGAERMTERLASLMRTSLDQQATPLVALDDELHTVRDYLAIEQVRFGSRLRYTLEIDDAARAARVPRMSVQTLVENSVKFAVSPRRTGATIAITATVDGSAYPAHRTFTIAVTDDGPGFDATALPAGHGLALLRDRLALLFRGGDGLRVESVPGRTAVTLTVPETHDRPS